MTPTSQNWPPGPTAPGLPESVIHIWRAELAEVGDDVCELLCSEERARAERMAHPRGALLWARSRGTLRALLGRYLDVDGSGLDFAMGAHGKPALDPESVAHPYATRLCFNLSHSGEIALYAFALDVDVGVDVELSGQPGDVLALAGRVFGPDEARRLRTLDPSSRRREFLRSWVRHEAKLKCLGVGIGAAAVQEYAREPWVSELDVGGEDTLQAAIAATLRPSELCRWSWAVG